MGTVCVPNAGHLSVIDFLRRELECDKYKIIDHSIQGSVAYLALKKNVNGNREVFGCVVRLASMVTSDATRQSRKAWDHTNATALSESSTSSHQPTASMPMSGAASVEAMRQIARVL